MCKFPSLASISIFVPIMESLDPTLPHSIPQRPPWRNVMLLLGFILVGMAVGNLLALLLVVLLSTFDETISFDRVQQLVQNPEQFRHGWEYLMLIQAVSHVFAFLLPSLLYWRWGEQQHLTKFIKKPFPPTYILLLALLTVLVFMPFDSWIIEWNSQMHLPQGLERVENWMRREEDQLARLTQYLTNFTQYWQLIIAVLVIAVIPAIGEEILFRGLVQRKIFNKTANMHAAIWIAAALFSAIHLQFYGFVPRLLLGAMFGYLYAWSANLWVPIFAHFVNNAFTVVLLFLNNRGVLDFDIESSQSTVSWPFALLSLLATILLLVNLKTRTERYRAEHHIG
jgi:uncharacterized protein